MKITVYSTTTCPYCVALKEWLDENKIEHEYLLVDQNPYAAQMMIQQSGQRGVPFTTVEKDDGSLEKVLGFDRIKLKQALNIK